MVRVGVRVRVRIARVRSVHLPSLPVTAITAITAITASTASQRPSIAVKAAPAYCRSVEVETAVNDLTTLSLSLSLSTRYHCQHAARAPNLLQSCVALLRTSTRHRRYLPAAPQKRQSHRGQPRNPRGTLAEPSIQQRSVSVDRCPLRPTTAPRGPALRVR